MAWSAPRSPGAGSASRHKRRRAPSFIAPPTITGSISASRRPCARCSATRSCPTSSAASARTSTARRPALERLDDLGRPGPGVDALVPLLDLAVLVDHHADALRALLRIGVGAVGGADRPVGVTDQREVEVVLLGELLVVVLGVERHPEDHGVLPVVVGFQVAEPATFCGSPRGVGLRKEPQHDRLAPEVRELHGAAVVVAAREIGSLVAWIEHEPSFMRNSLRQFVAEAVAARQMRRAPLSMLSARIDAPMSSMHATT